MAFASSRIGAQEALIELCGLCKDEENVNWFCKDCVKNLCERCKIGHLEIETCKNHQIVPMLEGIAIIKDNVSTLCSNHNEHFSFFCRKCDIIICSKCLVESHNGHNLIEIHEFRSEEERKLELILKEKESVEYQMIQNLEAWSIYESRMQKRLTESCDTIDERQIPNKLVGDEEGIELKKSLKSKFEKRIAETKDVMQHIDLKKNLYHKEIQEVRQRLKLQTVSTLKKFVQTCSFELRSLKPLAIPVPHDIFVVGDLNMDQIRTIISKDEGEMDISKSTGNVEKCRESGLQIEDIYKLELNTDCTKICASPDGSMWIGVKGYVYKMKYDCSEILEMIQTRGQMACTKIACFSSGDAVVSYDLTPYVDKFMNDGRRMEFAQLKDLPPRDVYNVAVTYNDNVAVMFSPRGWFSSQSSLIMFTKKGDRIKEVAMGFDSIISTFCIDIDDNFIIPTNTSPVLIKIDRSGKLLKKIAITTPNLGRMRCDRFGNILGVPGDTNDIYVINDYMGVERLFTVESNKDIKDICIDRDNRLCILLNDNSIIVTNYLK